MMELYGKAVVEERLKPRHLAELAAYVRMEYGPGVGPAFLLADTANGAGRKPWRRRSPASTGVLGSLVKAMRGLVAGNGDGRKSKVLDSTR